MGQARPLAVLSASLAGAGFLVLLAAAEHADARRAVGFESLPDEVGPVLLRLGTLLLGGALAVFVSLPSPPPADSPQERLHEKALCPLCLQPNRPWETCCRRCGVPTGAYGALLPLEAARLQGWGRGEVVVRRRPSTLLLVGGWLLWGPEAVALGFFALGSWWGGRASDPLVTTATVVAALLFAGWGALALTSLVRITRHHLEGRRRGRRLLGGAG